MCKHDSVFVIFNIATCQKVQGRKDHSAIYGDNQNTWIMKHEQ